MEPQGEEIRIGVSSCLLGERVRYDGGHKLDHFIRDTLGSYVRLVPVCPEVELGLGAPRETMQLVDNAAMRHVQLVSTHNKIDRTEEMRRYALARCATLRKEGLSGYIVQTRSPSCGVASVPVTRENSEQVTTPISTGLFAHTLQEEFPNLPIAESIQLANRQSRSRFFRCAFAYSRLRRIFSSAWTLAHLVAFHAQEKMLLLAHDRGGLTRLGRLVANAKTRPYDELRDAYTREFLDTVAKHSTRGNQVDVLQHMCGHLRSKLKSEQRQVLHNRIESFRNGKAPLLSVSEMIRHHANKHDVTYVAQQSFLNPHPSELILRTIA